tara:strand:- start:41 stop:445 length:405 start_codon:yes stop_codon:yes gene_type:complete
MLYHDYENNEITEAEADKRKADGKRFAQKGDRQKQFSPAEESLRDTEESEVPEISVAVAKTMKIANVKEKGYNRLFKTDWYYIRKLEKDIAIPDDIVTSREAIKTKMDKFESDINKLTTKQDVWDYEINSKQWE